MRKLILKPEEEFSDNVPDKTFGLKSLPNPCITQIEEIEDDRNTVDQRYQSSTLKRRTKLMRGSERPKLFITNKVAGDASWENLSTIVRENLSRHQSRESTISDEDSGVWSGRSMTGKEGSLAVKGCWTYK